MSRNIAGAYPWLLLTTLLVVACSPVLSSRFVERDFSSASGVYDPHFETLKYGDVIFVETSALVTGYGLGKAASPPTDSALRIPLRWISPSNDVHPGPGSAPLPDRLLPSETAFLLMALDTRRATAPKEPFSCGTTVSPGEDLCPDIQKFVQDNQAALWDTLVASLLIVISPNANPAIDAVNEPSLVVKVDRTPDGGPLKNFCTDLRKNILYGNGSYQDSVLDPLINEFGKETFPSLYSDRNCLTSAAVITNPDELTFVTAGHFADYFSDSPNPVSPHKPTVQGDFYSDITKRFLSVRRRVIVERAGASLRSEEGNEHFWNLKEWSESRVCTDKSGVPLEIKWVYAGSRTIWINDRTKNARITQANGERKFERLDGSTNLFDFMPSVVVGRDSLAALYPSDIEGIGWGYPGKSGTAEPSTEACR